MKGPQQVGAIAGWATVLGILGFEVIGPGAIAGQRVSGTLDAAAISAYYRHPALAPLAAGVFVVAALFLIFAASLHAAAEGERRFYTGIGALFSAAAGSLYIAKSAAAVTLVTLAMRGDDLLPMFRFWDVLYNSGIYALEAGWIGFFGLSFRRDARFPRWLWSFSVVLSLMQLLNMTALFAGIPDLATLPANLGLAAWFMIVSTSLARRGDVATVRAAMPA